jgi:hypothetical protein
MPSVDTFSVAQTLSSSKGCNARPHLKLNIMVWEILVFINNFLSYQLDFQTNREDLLVQLFKIQLLGIF